MTWGRLRYWYLGVLGPCCRVGQEKGVSGGEMG
jgi:hypothetical protein